MDKKLQEMIAPYWVEEQQGVYIPLIDKVLLKDNVPKMPYDDYMDYAKANNVQIATKEELLQMYLQKDEINKILEEHNGDILNDWLGSSSEYYSAYEWFIYFGSGYCGTTAKHYSYLSRAVVALKENQNKQDMKQFSLEEYLKNPNRRIVTKDGHDVKIICTDRIGQNPIVALIVRNGIDEVHTYSKNGKNGLLSEDLDLYFPSEKQEAWVNIYRDSRGKLYTFTNVFDGEYKARLYANSKVVATCKIEWEE